MPATDPPGDRPSPAMASTAASTTRAAVPASRRGPHRARGRPGRTAPAARSRPPGPPAPAGGSGDQHVAGRGVVERGGPGPGRRRPPRRPPGRGPGGRTRSRPGRARGGGRPPAVLGHQVGVVADRQPQVEAGVGAIRHAAVTGGDQGVERQAGEGAHRGGGEARSASCGRERTRARSGALMGAPDDRRARLGFMRSLPGRGTGAVGRPALAALIAAGHEVTAAVRSPRSGPRSRRPGPCRWPSTCSTRRPWPAPWPATRPWSTWPPACRPWRPRPAGRPGRPTTAAHRGVRPPGRRRWPPADAVVQESIVFVYPDGGDQWLDAATTEAEPAALTASALVAEGHVARFTAAGGTGVVLASACSTGPAPPTPPRCCGPPAGASPWSPGPATPTSSIHVDDAEAAVAAPSARRRDLRRGRGRAGHPAGSTPPRWPRPRAAAGLRVPGAWPATAGPRGG